METKILLAALLISTFLGSTLASFPSPVFAQIGCGTMITTKTTLSASIGPCTGNGLVIGANGITLNCARNTISGTGVDVGVNLTGHTGVKVENCDATGFYAGFYLSGSSGNTLAKNTADNNGIGFLLTNSPGNTLTKNTADNNGNGFYLFSSS